MAINEAAFSLETFEFLCYSRNREMAARELTKLLNTLEVQYGALTGIHARLGSAPPAVRNAALLTRITAALSSLFSDPEFFLTPQGFGQLISWQRWIATLFSASSFGNADHVLRSMNVKGPNAELELTEASFVKFCLLYTPDSDIPADVQTLWSYNRQLAGALFFSLMAPRFLGTEAAHAKREALLGWLPPKLEEMDDLDQLPLAILHDVYLNCSYADRPDKHEIKRALNALIRKKLVKEGFADLDIATARGAENGKPVLMAVLEWFTSKHSIYRTHSMSLRALREKFHVVALGGAAQVDDAGRAVFDEFIPLANDIRSALRTVLAEAAKRRPAVLFYPSIGMFQPTIYLANMRLAPIQLTALGHGATSMSPFIDYYAIEEDIAGDPATYSEKLLLLPPDAMPHVRSSDAAPLTPQLREAPESVRIAVASTTMKLNPRFIKACVRIREAARTPVQFEFLIGFANGLTHEQVRRFIHTYLPDANVHSHQPYAPYMAVINNCDLFLNPFPYGNMNGIADMASVGLAGVCRTGPQVHEHIDGGLFRRMGLPEWLIAKSDDDYIAAAVRLIDDPRERLQLRRALIARGGEEVLLEGRPEILGEKLAGLVEKL
ncbi:MAG: peptide transporter [Proteobacteria bacterium]|nr:peptide transporter [Pseudomonadota bacterium]